ncbi:beta-galactosidase [Streptomyces sp. NPDC059875]|uniref:beta-galactosidase n=1 Tax=unclassified Streptomyces TaxID=2593676 RepID=UPI00365A803C
MTARSITDHLGGLAFGGDYNLEQWDEPVPEGRRRPHAPGEGQPSHGGRLSWALLEPGEGRYDFTWLHAHIDRLHANGVAADVATPTASPRPWF